jgi:hypothetical protein
MRIVSCSVIDVREGEYVQAGLSTAACCVDGKQDRPSDDSADEGHHCEHLEEANVQVGIEGVMAKDVLVARASKVWDPAQEAMACRRCFLPIDSMLAAFYVISTVAYSSKSVSWYVRGEYKRRCFLRRSKKPPTRTAASTKHGAKVDTRADIEEGPPRELPAREEVLGADMLIQQCISKGRNRGT